MAVSRMQTQVYLVPVVLLHLVRTNLPLEGLELLLGLGCLGSNNSSSRHKLPHHCLARLQAQLVLGSLVQEVSTFFYFASLIMDCVKNVYGLL